MFLLFHTNQKSWVLLTYFFFKYSYPIQIICTQLYDLNIEQVQEATSTKQQLYGHFSPTTQVRWTRHAGYCWRSRDELISDVLLWTPWHGRAKAGRPTRTYIQQLCADTGCNPEDLSVEMENREGWRKRSGRSVLMVRHDDDDDDDDITSNIWNN